MRPSSASPSIAGDLLWLLDGRNQKPPGCIRAARQSCAGASGAAARASLPRCIDTRRGSPHHSGRGASAPYPVLSYPSPCAALRASVCPKHPTLASPKCSTPGGRLSPANARIPGLAQTLEASSRPWSGSSRIRRIFRLPTERPPDRGPWTVPCHRTWCQCNSRQGTFLTT